MTDIPVITIDGASGSGKGTVSQMLAQFLGWHFLDSGALYRVLALAAQLHKVDMKDEERLESMAEHLDVQFLTEAGAKSIRVMLEGGDVTEAIRLEETGNNASIVSAFPGVRKALLTRQRGFRTAPGLIADGRDMGTVVFPDAFLKIFLEATPEERAKRRCKQLHDKGISVKFETLLSELKARDERDKTRAVSPLLPAEDAIVIDTTALSAQQVFEKTLEFFHKYRS